MVVVNVVLLVSSTLRDPTFKRSSPPILWAEPSWLNRGWPSDVVAGGDGDPKATGGILVEGEGWKDARA